MTANEHISKMSALADADPIPRWTVPPVEYDTDQSPEWYGNKI